MRAVVYVDGENHFLRTQEVCKRHFDGLDSLEAVRKRNRVGGAAAFPDELDPIVEARSDAFFFWDKHIFDYLDRKYRRAIAMHTRNVVQGVYATSITGSDDHAHEARVWIRNRGFDPLVHHELTDARKSREGNVNSKPKTVDVALAVRILEDAYRNIYDACYLFTSDLDFVPVIEAVKRLGKQVVVCGYRHAIGKRSELEFVPDGFADIKERIQDYQVDEVK